MFEARVVDDEIHIPDPDPDDSRPIQERLRPIIPVRYLGSNYTFAPLTNGEYVIPLDDEAIDEAKSGELQVELVPEEEGHFDYACICLRENEGPGNKE